MNTIERTKEARRNKTYSYEAIVAGVLALLPELPSIINWTLSDPTAISLMSPAVSRGLHIAAFVLALYARSIVVRAPKVPTEPPTDA